MITTDAQRMFDASVRIEKMFWIAGICAQPHSDFQDFLEDEMYDSKDIMAKLPWLKPLVESRAEAEDVMAEFAMRNVDGFFVQLATPKPYEFFPDEGGYSSSWSVYRIAWMFCPTLDDIVLQAVAWQKELVETERAKAAAKAA